MFVRLVRWWLVLIGGVLLGAGAVLHAQVALAQHSREEVQSVFFLWRGFGQLTFIFQDDETKMALWLNELPAEMLLESQRAAWTLVLVGVVVASFGTFVRPRLRTKGRSK